MKEESALAAWRCSVSLRWAAPSKARPPPSRPSAPPRRARQHRRPRSFLSSSPGSVRAAQTRAPFISRKSRQAMSAGSPWNRCLRQERDCPSLRAQLSGLALAKVPRVGEYHGRRGFRQKLRVPWLRQRPHHGFGVPPGQRAGDRAYVGIRRVQKGFRPTCAKSERSVSLLE